MGIGDIGFLQADPLGAFVSGMGSGSDFVRDIQKYNRDNEARQLLSQSTGSALAGVSPEAFKLEQGFLSQQSEAQQAEQQRMLMSVARDAKTALGISDPAQRNQYLGSRVQRIVAEGGDPSDTLALMKLPFEQQTFELQDAINQIADLSTLTGGSSFLKSAPQGKFIGTPQRVSEGGKNFLTGVVQKPDGTFGEERIEISGDFVSTLGQTAAEKTRSAIQEAGGKEVAKLKAQFKLKPKVAEAVALANARGKAAADIETKGRSNQTAFDVYQTSINNLTEALTDTTTGPVLGFIPAMTANQQIADGAVAMMGQTLKQVFRSAGEGTFTDADQKALLGLAPTRQDLPKARVAKIKMIDSIIRAKLEQPTGDAEQEVPAERPTASELSGENQVQEGQIIVNPTTGERLRLVNGQYVEVK